MLLHISASTLHGIIPGNSMVVSPITLANSAFPYFSDQCGRKERPVKMIGRVWFAAIKLITRVATIVLRVSPNNDFEE